ncbi:MAG: dephospho-CoA kinase [Mycoplasmataceae bacterium]|jgi:dephospho-CoA kinase|nr:dephospho-CoA kinase [Mycoplasmataceae bacterium]
MVEVHTSAQGVKNSMLVCVTGAIGSGKTTAIKIIRQQGFQTFVMDDYIHKIYQKNQIGYKLIAKHFGKSYLTPIEVNRKALGQLVFSKPNALRKLDQLMIPLMRAQLQALLDQNNLCYVELGIYFLHESKFKKYFSKIIFIDAKTALKNTNLEKKMAHIEKFPTKIVGNSKLSIKTSKNNRLFVVENHKNLNYFKKHLINIL